MGFIEKQRELPVNGGYDVVVIGGGTAGAFAAIAAATEGSRVILVEQFGKLGGTATVGLVCPIMHAHIEGNPTCSYIGKIVTERLRALGACAENGTPNPTAFDPLILSIVLEQLAVEKGVKILYHTYFCDTVTENGKVTGIIIENKSGRSVISGKVYIDCTGDGDVCVRAGANYVRGNPETGYNQPVSLRYIVAGVDFEKYGAFMRRVCEETKLGGCSPDIHYAAVTSNGKWAFTHIFDKAIENGDLVPDDKVYWQSFTVPGRPGAIAFNNPEFFDLKDATDAEGLSSIQVQGKTAILRQMAFYKKYFEGFETAYLAEISGMVGIRESRNIVADYVLSGEEMLAKAKFEDAVCISNYPVDIHGKTLQFGNKIQAVDDGRPYYEIPYRTTLVKGFENLMVAGRCIGADFLAESSLRVMHSVRALGEAAGIGAAFAVNEGVTPRDIDGARVRNHMLQLGADFGKDYR